MLRALIALMLAAPLLLAATSVSGTISSNTDWDTSGSPYVVSSLSISPGAILTIAAGVVVKFSSAGSLLEVQGSLAVNGTAAQPVVFTSIKDDAAGGDTNGDGSASSPAAGDWATIWLLNGAKASINYAIVRYGGSQFYCCTIPYGLVAISTTGTVSIANGSFTNSLTSGVNVSSGTQVTITGNTFAHDATGITVASGTAGTISNNAFTTSSTTKAISMDASFLGSVNGNTASGSGTNAIVIPSGTVSGNATWGETHMPYDVANPSVSTSGALTIAAGVVVKFSSAGSLLEVQGSLAVNGTAAQPVVFTSIKDDAAGGDTNGDGSASSPAAGDWATIWLLNGAKASINYAIVRYGGSQFYCCTIPYGLVAISTTGTVSIANGSFTNSLTSGVNVSSGTQVTITGNTFAHDATGITVASGTAGTISNNAFTTSSTTKAISMDASFLGSVNGNTASGSGTNAIVIPSGTVSGNATWGETHMPYDVANPSVSTSGALTIAAGVVVKFSSAGSLLEVQGSLAVNGTAAQPVVFTSIKDDAAGGDTNGDGSASSPAAGDWATIWLLNGAKASINYAIVRYGGSQFYCCTIPYGLVVISTTGTVSIANGSFTNSLTSGVNVSSGTQVTITGNTFAHDATGITVASGTAGTISNNAFTTSSTTKAISMDASFLGSVNGNTASGSGTNAIVIPSGTVSGNATWGETHMPYDVANPSVSTSGALTIAAGVVVKFSSAGSLLEVQGSLAVNGTAAQPVVFTSIKDDAAGGDTNGDGSASSPAAGDWATIWLLNGAKASINYAIVRYGGSQFYCCTIPYGLVVISTTGTVSIANGSFTNSLTSGVNVSSGTQVTITGNTFAHDATGITVASGTAGTISNNAFTTSSTTKAISMDASFLGSVNGNTASGSGTNAIVIPSGTVSGNATWGETHMPYDVANPSVSTSGALTIAAGVVVKFSSAGSLLEVQGSLAVNGTAAQPVVFTSIKDDAAGGDTNGDGSASSPAAGDWATIWLLNGAKASINYAIVRYGGSQFYCCTIPYGLVVISTTGTVSIANGSFTNSLTSGVNVSSGTQVTITGNTFAHDQVAISANGGTTTHIHNNSFQFDSSYGVLNVNCNFSGSCSNPDIDATNNYWGSASGPSLNSPGGARDRVSFHVTYIPFLGQPSTGGAPPPMQTLLGQPGSSSTNVAGFTSEPINTATGNYYLTKQDLRVPSIGIPFALGRSYNSEDGYSGPLGAGWTHSYNIVLTLDGTTGDVTIKEPDGHEDFYSPAGSGAYVPAIAGLFDTLQQNSDNSFTLTRKNQTTLRFSPAGTLTSITDRNGNTQTFNYAGSGNLVSVIDTSGRTFSFAYDASARITSLSDPIGRTWSYSYDTNGNLASVTDASGAITQYTYDANHRMLTAIDARGVTFLQNTYDSQGRVATQTNGRGFVTTLAYNSPTTGTTTFTDPLGNATQDVYDGALRLIERVDANSGTISYTYDANNDRMSITNQNGNTMNLTYDGTGNATSVTDPLGNVQTFTYDLKSDLLTATNPKGATTTFSYDANGNLLGIKDALGDTTAFAYNSSGLLTSKTDARRNATSYAYDATGDLTRVTDPLGDVTTLTYDSTGRLLAAADPNGHTASVTYDALNRILQTTDALNHATQFSYDAIGHLLKITDANGNATSYSYDATNSLAGVTDALGDVTSYAYDANNNRIGFTNAKGNTTSYAFDALNRLAKITDPLSFTSSYAYDAVGNAIATTDANGRTKQYAYDVLNRLLKGSYADGTSVSFTYDKDGKRATMVDSRGTTTYSYDALDRVLSVASPNTATVQYAYDPVGNRTTLGYPDGRAAQYQYDALNRLSQVTDWASKVTRYTYDPASNLTGFTYPNGASSLYSFDAANRLLEIVNRSGNNVLSSFTYLLDGVGNRLQVTSAAGGTTAYGYDPLYRLISWTAPSGQPTQYTYDPVGNRLSMVSSAATTPYTYDADDRMLSAGSTSYGYDNNGNQISKTTGSNTVSYSYDALNHLIAASGSGINSQYQYDGDGNRVAQTVPTGTYEYLNDTATGFPVVLNEMGPDGNIDYLYGLSMISETSSAFQYFYQSDGLGSIASLTDATGALKASYSYDPWGKLLVPIDPLGTKNKYKFTGEVLDPGANLLYMRARYYDPTVGRFISADPFGFVADKSSIQSRYQYGLANPVRMTDPRGLFAIDSENIGNAQSTIPFSANGAGGGCGSCAVGLVVDISNVILNDKALQSVGDVLVLPSLAIDFGSDLSNGVDLGHALGRLGVNAAINAGVLEIGVAGGPPGVVAALGIDIIYDTATLIFGNQINGAIDATFNMLGNGLVQMNFQTGSSSASALPVTTPAVAPGVPSTFHISN